MVLYCILIEIGKEFYDLIAERQLVHSHTDRHLSRAALLHSEHCFNSIKFYLMLVYLGKYTIKLLSNESTVLMGNICSDVQGSWTLIRSVDTP